MLWIFFIGIFLFVLSGILAGISLFARNLKIKLTPKADKILNDAIFIIAVSGFVLIIIYSVVGQIC